jgi:FkbM family methyltransferase
VTTANLFEEQLSLLQSEPIVACANRQGLRKTTGNLLEAAFIDLAAALAPVLSVEIGAHEAHFSVAMKSRVPSVRAIAFEANPHAHSHFAAELLDRGIDYRLGAVCDHEGSAEMKVVVAHDGNAIDKVNKISGLRSRVGDRFDYEIATVPAIRIDTVLDGIDTQRSVAWIDAEGGQREIFAGGSGFFACVTAVFIEVENVESWHGQVLAADAAAMLAGFGLIPAMRDNLASDQFNEVYIRNAPGVLQTATPIISAYVTALRGLIA